MADDTQLLIKINGDEKGYKDALKKAAKETEELQDTLNSIAKTGAIAFASFGASILFAAKSAAKFETIETQFEVLTGSVEKAQETIQNLSDFSAKTPFNFTQIAQAGKQLLGFQFAAEQIPDVLQRIGDVSAATGAGFNDMTLIFGQVRAAGKLTGERLLQLEERAVPIGPALAKTMGVAETAIRDMVSNGEVSFATFEKAFATLSEKGGLAFEGMEKNSKTLEGKLSTLGDNFDLVTASVGEHFLPVLKQATTAFINFFEFIRENPGLSSFIAKLLVVGTTIAGVTVTGALLGIGLLKLRASIIATALSTRTLSFAFKGLIGSTGIGLLIAFLPEIISLFTSLDNTMSVSEKRQAQALKKRNENLQKNRNVKNDLFKSSRRISEEETKFLKVNQDEQEEDQKKHIDNTAKIANDGTNKKIQKLKDENELIKAQLAGIEREELSFLQRRQDIANKELEAKTIQDQNRKNLALANVKLLNQLLLADEKELVKKRSEIAAELEKNEIEKAKKEEERNLAKQQRADDQERKEIERALAEIVREDKAVEAADAKEQKEVEKAANDEERTKERIQKLNEEAELLKAHQDGLETEEIGFLERRQKLKAEEAEAASIIDEEERALLFENLQIKHEELLLAEQDFLIKRSELKDEAAKEDDLKRKKEQNLFEKDLKKHGEIVAKIKAVQRSEGLSNAATAANELAKLQQSENSKLQAIGKAAALVQIAIDTQRGAIAAYTALAGIPIVGPGLGIAAASALTIFGLERASKVQGLQDGGVVGGTGFGDKIQAFLEPQELIVPRQNFEEVINAVSNQRSADQGETIEPDEETAVNRLEIGFDGEEAADVLTVKQNEQNFLGTSQQLGIV